MRDVILAIVFFFVAMLYAAVGHGGASGYRAAMLLFDVSLDVQKRAALLMNLCTAGAASWQFYRAGFFRWRLFWPVSLLAIPLAYWGAKIDVPREIFQVILALVLLAAAVRFLWKPTPGTPRPMYLPLALGLGAIIGLVSGITSIGGGILLSPVLVLLGWATTQEAAAIAAPFIFVNSLSGLLGAGLPADFPRQQVAVWCLLALVGGILGGYWGSRAKSTHRLLRVLGVVLILAGIGKLLELSSWIAKMLPTLG
jgi:uncharacterized membrane protein YfcA